MRLLLFYLLFSVLLVPLEGRTQTVAAGARGPSYAGQDLTNFNFTKLPPGTLVGADFTGAILNGAQFQNVNLTNATFNRAQLRRSAKGVTNLNGAILDHASFQDASLDSASLQFAKLKATDFSRASLLFTAFGPTMTIQRSEDGIRTKFAGTKVNLDRFPINRWPAAYWAMTDLGSVQINGLTKENFSFRGRDISGAKLDSANFTGFDFQGCILRGADLSHARLDYAVLDSAILDGAKLVEATLSHVRANWASFRQDGAGQPVDASGAVFNHAVLHGSAFNFARLQRASLSNAIADSCDFTNATLQAQGAYGAASLAGANVSNAFFASAQLSGVNFSNAYLTGSRFERATLTGTNFSGAVMPGSVFQSCLLQGVLFTGAVLQNADFSNATIGRSPVSGSGVNFSCAHLGGADFTSATVTDADFQDAVITVRDSCCPTTTGGSYCGTVAVNQMPYGATKLPVLSVKMPCPNGDIAACSGTQWIIPGWRTSTSCGRSGSDQVAWFKPSCGKADTAGQIRFQDTALRGSIVRQLYKTDQGQVITRSIAAQVLSLDCSGQGIRSLAGLEAFTALRQLNLANNRLVEIGPLRVLKQLNTLDLSHNLLGGARAPLDLQGMEHLNALDVSHNQIEAVLLHANADLTYLNAAFNKLKQFKDLDYMRKLVFLNLSHNELNDLDRLSDLTELNTLYLQNNSLKTIGSIAGLYNDGAGRLLFVNLNCNPGFDCATLGLSTKAGAAFRDAICGKNNLPECGMQSTRPVRRVKSSKK